MKRRPLARNCRSNGVKGLLERKLWMPAQRIRVSSQNGECDPNQ